MTDINETLKQRNSTHGDFWVQARVAQNLKSTARLGDSWSSMTGAQREAIDMILHKVSRIVCGNSSFDDHWLDIQGYAKIGNVHETE